MIKCVIITKIDYRIFYRWMAMQCGLSREQVNAVKTPAELNKMLRPLVHKRFKLVAEGRW